MIGPISQNWPPMLAIDIGPMIDRTLDDNCGRILAFLLVLKSLAIIGRELLLKSSRRSFEFIMTLIYDKI